MIRNKQGILHKSVPLDQIPFAYGPTSAYLFNTGITTSAEGVVSIWADSANSNDLVQATTANGPTKEGDNTILFDGVSQQLEATFTLNQPFTVCLVFRQVTWTDNDIITDGSTGAARLIQQTTSPRLKLFAGSAVADNDNLTVNTYGAVSYVMNGASSSIQVNKGTATTGNAGATNPGGLSLGGSLSITSCSNIQVKEGFVYPYDLDSGQISVITNYFNNKFALGL